MKDPGGLEQIFYTIWFIILAVCMLLTLIRAFVGRPRFTDRVMCANLISTKTMAFIIVIGLFLSENFVYDIALVYAVFGFVAVVILSRFFSAKRGRKPHLTDVVKNADVTSISTDEEVS